jgi:hypothetical protein
MKKYKNEKNEKDIIKELEEILIKNELKINLQKDFFDFLNKNNYPPKQFVDDIFYSLYGNYSHFLQLLKEYLEIVIEFDVDLKEATAYICPKEGKEYREIIKFMEKKGIKKPNYIL